ncbi:MAG TPA: hypothetical protein VHC69_31165 [Polyangiaceae bacterium]|nr:hypothetical protein [Polyangiaceae bacterium]
MDDSSLLVGIKQRLDEIYDLLHDPDKGAFARIHDVADDVRELMEWRKRMERNAMLIATPVAGLLVKAAYDLILGR